MNHSETISVIGAGLAGPLLAISLADRALPVVVYEKRADMRRVPQDAGKSINLAVSARGIYAMEQAGIWDSMRNITIPMRGRMMHAISGELTFQPYGKDETESIYSISRADLNIALMNAAEARGVEIRFNHPWEGAGSGMVIGADGANSTVRRQMVLDQLSQEHLDYGYKELTIPAGTAMERHALHIWPRGAYMLIALPNIDGSFACILFLPFEGETSFAALDTAESVRAFFETNFPDAARMMPGLIENYFANPVGSMVTIRCAPWHANGRVLLLGDAAHAIVPFFGQGLNCAFEDVTCLTALLDRRGPDWPTVFAEFQQIRKENTGAIADMALENFVEMRDRVADPRFLDRKRIERELEARYPGWFVPKYSMVTFHRVDYAVALRRGAIQDRILDRLAEDQDWEKAGRAIRTELTPLQHV